jgi:tetratricopeptide (TPR) repeat protein
VPACRLTGNCHATQHGPHTLSAEARRTPGPTARSLRTPARLWCFRAIAAIGIPALLFLGLEGGLRIAGFGRSVRFLVPDEKPGYFRTNPDFVSSFMPSSFDLRPLNFRVARQKPPNSVRIVVLGESAAQGIPVPSFGFAAQLRAQLRERYPGKQIEVINTGIVAINSHVVYQIARELAGFSPDLFVVYLGNNEVVGPYGPGCTYLSEMPPLWVIRLSVFVRSTRTGQLVMALVGKFRKGKHPSPEWGGMAMFADSAVRGDDPRLEVVYRNFGANLEGIVGAASGAGAQTILCTVVSNLKDCAPLLSLHRPDLTGPELGNWGRVYTRGVIEWLLGKGDAARIDLNEALRIDWQYAEAAYLLGSLELEGGDAGAARHHFIEAEHWDALRFRPDPRINDVIRGVARSNSSGVHLLDAAALMGSDPSSDGTPAGRELLFEHVHFDWDGNYRLARAMAEASEEALFGGAKGAPPWLDSSSCAAALAYSDHERLGVLEKVRAIVQNPPFPNQVTYPEDEARLARDIASAAGGRGDPAKLRQAKEIVQAAVAADRENPDLARIAEDIDDDLGDIAGALAESLRAQDLQPRSFALATDEAIKLSRLGRFDEAERLLRETAAACPPRDRVAMTPAFADFFTRTKRINEGKRFMDAEIFRNPNDSSLKLLKIRLLRLSGDNAGAEQEYRDILADDPSNQAALEALVKVLTETGDSSGAEKASLSAVELQPRNLANNLRAAIIYDARGDNPQAVKCLLAAERSGPVTAAVESHLAAKLLVLQRLDETLFHLGEARRISVYEGDSTATQSIDRSIDYIWSQLH